MEAPSLGGEAVEAAVVPDAVDRLRYEGKQSNPLRKMLPCKLPAFPACLHQIQIP